MIRADVRYGGLLCRGGATTNCQSTRTSRSRQPAPRRVTLSPCQSTRQYPYKPTPTQSHKPTRFHKPMPTRRQTTQRRSLYRGKKRSGMRIPCIYYRGSWCCRINVPDRRPIADMDAAPHIPAFCCPPSDKLPTNPPGKALLAHSRDMRAPTLFHRVSLQLLSHCLPTACYVQVQWVWLFGCISPLSPIGAPFTPQRLATNGIHGARYRGERSGK
jgi:hypothetical protein